MKLANAIKSEVTISSVPKRPRGRPRKNLPVVPKNIKTALVVPKNINKAATIKKVAPPTRTLSKRVKETIDKKTTIKEEKKPIVKVKKEKKYKVNVQRPTPLNCGLCPLKLKSKAELGVHVESHKGSSQCQQCDMSFPMMWQKALSHRYSHLVLKNDVLECHLCWHKYENKAAFESHYVVDHVLKDNKDFPCIHCHKVYPTRRKLQKHLPQHSDKQFICDYCSKCYNQKAKLTLHIRSHTKVFYYKCKLCPEAFRYHASLITHTSKEHRPVRIYCDLCKRHFPDELRRRKHKCTAPQQCNICGKIFFKSGQLRRHLVCHTDEYAHKCHRCPAKFKHKGNLNLHLKRHDNVRPHKCSYCPDRFFTGGVLKKHIAWKHTGERSFVCKVCTKGFAAVHNLRVHMRVHGEYLITKKGQTTNESEGANGS